MPLKLVLFIIFISVGLFIYVIYNVKKGYLSTKHSLLWVCICFTLCLFALIHQELLKVATFFGIETVSNMLFFFALILILLITFNLTKHISKQNKEIIKLTQELALLKKVENNDKKSK